MVIFGKNGQQAGSIPAGSTNLGETMKKILILAAFASLLGCDLANEETVAQPKQPEQQEKTWQPRQNAVVSSSYSSRGSEETFEDGSTHTVNRDAMGRTTEDRWTPPTKERR